ncbi:MAG: ABC transporter permease [Paramuribaculum sp.]|nr:ABC transporter permease [Paramuribaculum sp.]
MTALRIALRYLFSRKKHNAVNVISWISVAGVAVATAAIVCVLSVFNGFSNLAFSRLSEVDPDIKIVPVSGKTFANGDSLAVALTALPEFELAVPVIEERALAIYGGRQLPVTIKGVPDNYSRISNITNTVIDGELLDSTEYYPCATLSVGVALSLNARPDYYELLSIYAPRRVGRVNAANPMNAFRGDSLIVSGVYEVEQNEYDADKVIVPISTAKKILDYTDESTGIELKLATGVSEKQGLFAAQRVVGETAAVQTRLMQQAESFRMISVEKWITFLMLAFILVIASFNVISIMSMLIIEKKDNIATFSALGATSAMIRRVFVYEGWLISLLGGAVGLILGVALCLVQQHWGLIKLGGDPSHLSVSVYPVQLQLGDLAAVAMIVAVTGLFIGLIAGGMVKPGKQLLRNED